MGPRSGQTLRRTGRGDGHAVDQQAFGQPAGGAGPVGDDDDPVAVGKEGGQPPRDAILVARRTIPTRGDDGGDVGSIGYGVERPHRCPGVDEQAIPVGVQPGEPGVVGTPRDGQGGGQVGLFGPQVGDTVAQPARFDGQHERIVVDEVEQHPFVAGQPWQPRFHAVEQLAVGEAVPLLPPPRLLGDQGLGPGPHLVVGNELAARMDLDLGPGHGGPLVGHPELGEPVDLITPQVDAHRGVGRRRPHVDDRTPYRQLAAVFDLVLAPIPGGHQVGDEGPLVDLVTGAEPSGRTLAGPGTQPLDQGPTGSHDHPGSVGNVGEPVEDVEPAAHGLHRGAHPFEGQRLPRREHLDGVGPQVGAQVVGQAVGLGAGGYGDDDRAAVGPLNQVGDDHGPGRLGHRQGGMPPPEDVGERVGVVEQAG